MKSINLKQKQDLFFLKIFRFIAKLNKKIDLFIFKLKFNVKKTDKIILNLGSKYGSWDFVDDAQLHNCTIISCGLGEDASFDIEFANKYSAKIIIVDPTPRALVYYSQIINNLGQKKLTDYENLGFEKISSYDLTNVKFNQLISVPRALWNTETTLKFYSPPIESHVSHSLTNFQNNYSTNTHFIQVKTTTINNLITDYQISNLQILKLDIEGAETYVVNEMLNNRIYPKQILVEFDEMQNLTKEIKKKIITCHKNLINHNYKLIFKRNINFLYYYQNA